MTDRPGWSTFFDPIHLTEFFGGFNDSNGLNRGLVPKPFSLSIHNARCKDIATHIVCFRHLNYGAVSLKSWDEDLEWRVIDCALLQCIQIRMTVGHGSLCRHSNEFRKYLRTGGK